MRLSDIRFWFKWFISKYHTKLQLKQYFIDFDFNKESPIDFGKEWPTFNHKMCECKLSSDFAIDACPIHNQDFGFAEETVDYSELFEERKFSDIWRDDSKIR